MTNRPLKILVTGQHRGSTSALMPIAKELMRRGHDLTLLATGNENEAKGFADLPYDHQPFDPQTNYNPLFAVGNYDLLLVGLSGYRTADGTFTSIANQRKIPSIGVLDQPVSLHLKFAQTDSTLPTLIAVPTRECISRIEQEVGEDLSTKVGESCRIVGWVAYDHLNARKGQKPQKDFFTNTGIDPQKPVRVHFTSNTAPHTKYCQNAYTNPKEAWEFFTYEMALTRVTFGIAADLGLKLVVKPHPGEEGDFTSDLAKRHGFLYLPAQACSTIDLMLAADTTTAGRSGTINEACLLDRNVAALLPDLDPATMRTNYPAVGLGAIPAVFKWTEIEQTLRYLASSDPHDQARLLRNRQRFSVDGEAAIRIADIIETQF